MNSLHAGEWTSFSPSKLSWLQITPTNELLVASTGEVIPSTEAFRIELENGTLLERTSGETSTFCVSFPMPQGFAVSEYRFFVEGARAEWQTRSLAAQITGPGAEPVASQSRQNRRPWQISLGLVETLSTLVFMGVVLWQVVFLDRAMKKEPVQSFEPPPTQVDGSDEFVPDSSEPLPVERH